MELDISCFDTANLNRKLKVGNDQEKAQPERDSLRPRIDVIKLSTNIDTKRKLFRYAEVF